MRVSDLWNLFEVVGGVLVLVGVIGEVCAALSEPEEERIGETSGMVLLIGLVFSLTVLVFTNGRLGSNLATMIQIVSTYR